MKQVDTNKIVAIAALLTSVVAVFIAWDEGRLQRRNQRASFLPLIDIRGSVSTGTDALSVSVTATNRGHGVAFIKSFEVFHGNRPITTWQELESALLTEQLARQADLSWADPEGYLQAGDGQTLLELRWPSSSLPVFRQQFFVSAETTIAAFDARACYCSVFGECWTTTLLGDVEPEPVGACPARTSIMSDLWEGFVAFQAETVIDD